MKKTKKKPHVAVICEASQSVTAYLLSLGIQATSIDLRPPELGLPHIQADCFSVDYSQFTSAIAFPPCTYLCKAQVHLCQASPGRQRLQEKAIKFVRRLYALPIPRLAIENPVGVLSTRWKKPDTIVYPWQFGDLYTKEICLWLQGLPVPLQNFSAFSPLVKVRSVSNHVNGRMSQEEKSVIRSSWKWYPKTIKALVNQWRGLL